MTKEKDGNDEKQNKNCSSVFKNGILTKEDYTQVWIELISTLERIKSVKFSPSQ